MSAQTTKNERVTDTTRKRRGAACQGSAQVYPASIIAQSNNLSMPAFSDSRSRDSEGKRTGRSSSVAPALASAEAVKFRNLVLADLGGEESRIESIARRIQIKSANGRRSRSRRALIGETVQIGDAVESLRTGEDLRR